MAMPIREQVVLKSALSSNGIEYERNTFIVVCSNCRQQIYSPSNNVKYKYCYNCGAKFDEEINADKLRDIRKAR